MHCKGHLATATQTQTGRAFCAYTGRARTIIEWREPLGQIIASRRDFDRQRPLANRRQAVLKRDQRAYPLREAKSVQSGGSKNDGVILATIKASEASVQIATQAGYLQGGKAMANLRFSAQACGAHARPGGQAREIGMACADKGIAWIFAFKYRGERKTGGHLGRHILARVHGQIGAPLFQRDFQLLDEQSLAADCRQRAIEHLVALSAHG